MNCRTQNRQCIYISSSETNDSQLRRKLTEMKEARDSLEKKVLMGNIGNQASRQTQLQTLSGAPIASLEGDVGGHGDESDVEGYLEPTPLAIPDAAYAEADSEDLNDLGVALGRIRLGERVGGLFRPRVGDEVRPRLQCVALFLTLIQFYSLDSRFRPNYRKVRQKRPRYTRAQPP